MAVTYDTENKTAVMYLDGKELGAVSDYAAGEPVSLGKQNRGGGFVLI